MNTYRLIGRLGMKDGKPCFETECIDGHIFVDQQTKGMHAEVDDGIVVEYWIIVKDGEIAYKEKVKREPKF